MRLAIDGMAIDVYKRQEQHKPLIHAGGDVVKLRLTALELVQLRLDLAVLLVHAVQQGRKLVIRIVFERLVQIERHDRLEEHTAIAALTFLPTSTALLPGCW